MSFIQQPFLSIPCQQAFLLTVLFILVKVFHKLILHRWIFDFVDRLPRNSQRWHRRSSFHLLIVDRYAGVDINCVFYLEYQRIVITKNKNKQLVVDDTEFDGHIKCRYSGYLGIETVHSTVGA